MNSHRHLVFVSVPWRQDYEVLDMLGKGGFAQVFRAISKKNGQEIAIKRVRLKKKVQRYKVAFNH